MPEPLPTREAILDLLASMGKPMRSLEIAQRLEVADPAKPGFFRMLENLAMEGTLLAISRDRYGLLKQRFQPTDDEREGTLSVNQRGFGFVRSPDHDDDLFVSEDAMGGALHGDTVVARIVRRGGLGTSGEVIRILKHAQTRVPGTLRRKGASAWVEPDDPRIRGPIVLRQEASDVAPISVLSVSTPDENASGSSTEPSASSSTSLSASSPASSSKRGSVSAPARLTSKKKRAIARAGKQTPRDDADENPARDSGDVPEATPSGSIGGTGSDGGKTPKPVSSRGEDGDAVVVEITRFPVLPSENPEGRLIMVLGPPGDPRVEVLKILARQGVDEAHPAAAVTEADAFGNEVSEAALVGRVDLTGIPLPTIDPSDARDHDDAVWVERADDGSYTAYIAIADVSHYVQPGTALDEAALNRGCSVYLPDRAIPMLPRALSSNLCSLLPNVIRLCLCAIVTLDAGAHITSTTLVEGYMRSRAKLTYDGVARALGFTSKPKRQPEAEEMIEGLKVADTLARMLRTKRMKRGALDLNLPEPKVVLDPKTGAPSTIERRAEDPGIKKAYEIIEEFMLLANEVVAHFLVERGRPTVFRVHPPPDETKLETYAAICERMGAPFTMEDGRDPKKLAQFVKKAATLPRGEILHMLLLRALKQAFYDTSNLGHFGLASPEYVHFTSPIRRYPDLLVHRGVREVLRAEGNKDELRPWTKPVAPWPLPGTTPIAAPGSSASASAPSSRSTPAPSSVASRSAPPPSGRSTPAPGPVSTRSTPAPSSVGDAPPRRGLRTPKPPTAAPGYAGSAAKTASRERTDRNDRGEGGTLKDAAVLASTKERRAMEVEREVVDLYRALYMKDHVGETFEGTVTSMTGQGAFVALDSPYVDVLVRADAMGKDVYTLNEELMMYVGTRSGDKVMLGDRVMVTIEEVSLQRRLVTGWRFANNAVDNEPLRQSPFQMKEVIAKKKSKSKSTDDQKRQVRRVMKTSSRSGKPAKTKAGKAGGKKGKKR